MKLLIDDVRDVPGYDVIARTAKAGFVLMSFKLWDTVCFDHDLDYDKITGEIINGYELMKDAIRYNVLPNHVQIITGNPVGRKNMTNLLIDNDYTTKNNFDFYK